MRFIPGTPWMRISIGSWTSEEDVERLAVALTERLGAGRARPRSGERRDHERDVLVQVDAQLLGAAVTSSRLTPLAKLGCFSFLRTDRGSRWRARPVAPAPQAWTKPEISSQA